MKAQYTIAIDNETFKVLAYTPVLKDDEILIEGFAAAVHKKSTGDYTLVDLCEKGFVSCQYTLEGVNVLIDNMGSAPNSVTLRNACDVLESILEATDKLFVEHNKFKNPMKVKGFTSNLTNTQEDTIMPTPKTKATKAKAATKLKAVTTAGGRPADPKSKTGQVWAIADKNYKKSRADILALCVAKDINSSTAATQYGKWRADRIASKLPVGPGKEAKKAKAKKAA